MSEEIKLLPCPFCGEQVVFIKSHVAGEGGHIAHAKHVNCVTDNIASLYPDADTELIKQWNTRATPQPMPFREIMETISKPAVVPLPVDMRPIVMGGKGADTQVHPTKQPPAEVKDLEKVAGKLLLNLSETVNFKGNCGNTFNRAKDYNEKLSDVVQALTESTAPLQKKVIELADDLIKAGIKIGYQADQITKLQSQIAVQREALTNSPCTCWLHQPENLCPRCKGLSTTDSSELGERKE